MGFLDVVYLGIFVILSPAFDRRFYSKPPPALLNELAYAIRSFHSLMRVFALRSVVLLQGTAVAASYVVDRILAEFAAAAVVFGKGVEVPFGEGNEGSDAGITFPRFLEAVTGIVEEWSPDLLAFFSRRVQSDHKSFLWTGPALEIVPRTEDLLSIIHLAGDGELLDLPSLSIYCKDPDVPLAVPAPTLGKRDRSEDAMEGLDERVKKQKH